MPLSAGKIRTMVEPHSVSAGRETPSRTARSYKTHHLHVLAGSISPRALQAVRDGVLVNNQTSTPETEWLLKLLHVRSELPRVHREPRTERREFASLEPLKGWRKKRKKAATR